MDIRAEDQFSEFNKMEKGRNLVPSGVEPVDKLRGGLESGRLYLVHGEGPTKSLFGYQFLIEGLKRGEHVALIINYSPEDAVRWFARLGYDCLEDIYSGRLVVLECAEENFNQIARMKELAPVLRELRWLIGDKSPERVVFEPIGRLVIGDRGSTAARSREFAAWANDIGSTGLLIANGRSEELIADLLPLVRESFRFELKQENDLAIRYLFFEKSPDIPGQVIEADPSKGIFLVDRPSKRTLLAQPTGEKAPQESGGSWVESVVEAGVGSGSTRDADNERDPFRELISELFGGVEDLEEPGGLKRDPKMQAEQALADMAEAPAGSGYSLYRPDQPTAHAASGPPEEEGIRPAASSQEELERIEIGDMVEDLLKPPAMAAATGTDSAAIELNEPAPALEEQAEQPGIVASEQPGRGIRPQDFNVLIIAGDSRTGERITKSLSEYHLEGAGDGVSGLAKLISFKPDLVVLDVDLRAVDGFEMLEHIRANLDVPIIALSSSRLRASDRIRSAELGADCYLTKPFSSRELKHKARQLIGRYRRVDEWITRPAQTKDIPGRSPGRRTMDGPATGERRGAGNAIASAPEDIRQTPPAPSFAERFLDSGWTRSGQAIHQAGEQEPDRASMLPYAEFVRRIEQLVEVTIDRDTWFSVVGCRVNHSSDGHATARTAALAQMVPELIRNCDVASLNQSGDLMILLTDADPTGAKAFTTRLQETVQGKFKTDPVIWVRTFPSSNQPDE